MMTSIVLFFATPKCVVQITPISVDSQKKVLSLSFDRARTKNFIAPHYRGWADSQRRHKVFIYISFFSLFASSISKTFHFLRLVRNSFSFKIDCKRLLVFNLERLIPAGPTHNQKKIFTPTQRLDFNAKSQLNSDGIQNVVKWIRGFRIRVD